MNQPRITRRQIRCELVVRSDAAEARERAKVAVASRAPYTYAELAAAHRAGTLAELLGVLDTHTLRAQAVRAEVESGGLFTADEFEARFVRLLTTARFGRDG
jgi:hypothetical protein